MAGRIGLIPHTLKQKKVYPLLWQSCEGPVDEPAPSLLARLGPQLRPRPITHLRKALLSLRPSALLRLPPRLPSPLRLQASPKLMQMVLLLL